MLPANFSFHFLRSMSKGHHLYKSCRPYIPSFKIIEPLVLEKILKVLTIYMYEGVSKSSCTNAITF